MIINHDIIEKKFKCNKILGKYLIYELHLPQLSIDDKYYYFTDNDLLREKLQSLPLWLKLVKFF